MLLIRKARPLSYGINPLGEAHVCRGGLASRLRQPASRRHWSARGSGWFAPARGAREQRLQALGKMVVGWGGEIYTDAARSAHSVTLTGKPYLINMVYSPHHPRARLLARALLQPLVLGMPRGREGARPLSTLQQGASLIYIYILYIPFNARLRDLLRFSSYFPLYFIAHDWPWYALRRRWFVNDVYICSNRVDSLCLSNFWQ